MGNSIFLVGCNGILKGYNINSLKMQRFLDSKSRLVQYFYCKVQVFFTSKVPGVVLSLIFDIFHFFFFGGRYGSPSYELLLFWFNSRFKL